MVFDREHVMARWSGVLIGVNIHFAAVITRTAVAPRWAGQKQRFPAETTISWLFSVFDFV
jgi:hypothetical protein